jgi:hypothetical protein
MVRYLIVAALANEAAGVEFGGPSDNNGRTQEVSGDKAVGE